MVSGCQLDNYLFQNCLNFCKCEVPSGRNVPYDLSLQGNNQDLNLAKQKYEILTGHKNRC